MGEARERVNKFFHPLDRVRFSSRSDRSVDSHSRGFFFLPGSIRVNRRRIGQRDFDQLRHLGYISTNSI